MGILIESFSITRSTLSARTARCNPTRALYPVKVRGQEPGEPYLGSGYGLAIPECRLMLLFLKVVL